MLKWNLERHIPNDERELLLHLKNERADWVQMGYYDTHYRSYMVYDEFMSSAELEDDTCVIEWMEHPQIGISYEERTVRDEPYDAEDFYVTKVIDGVPTYVPISKGGTLRGNLTSVSGVPKSKPEDNDMEKKLFRSVKGMKKELVGKTIKDVAAGESFSCNPTLDIICTDGSLYLFRLVDSKDGMGYDLKVITLDKES